jgi:hypothetical protein
MFEIHFIDVFEIKHIDVLFSIIDKENIEIKVNSKFVALPDGTENKGVSYSVIGSIKISTTPPGTYRADEESHV